MNQSEKTPGKPGHDSTLRILVALVALLVMGAVVTGFVVVIDRLDALVRSNRDLQAANEARDRKADEKHQAAADRDEDRDAMQADMLGQLAQIDDHMGKHATERREAEAKHSAAIDRAEQEQAKVAKRRHDDLLNHFNVLGDRLRAAEARNDALAKEVADLRYPPLPDDEKALFGAYFSSVWPPRPYFKKESMPKGHLGLRLQWKQPVEKPSDQLLEHVRSVFVTLGSKLGKRLVLEACESKDEWVAAWEYFKERDDNKPIGVMNAEVYADRLRVTWYPGRAKERLEDTRGLRDALLSLAREVGAKAQTTYWGPRKSGYTDLYFK